MLYDTKYWAMKSEYFTMMWNARNQGLINTNCRKGQSLAKDEAVYTVGMI